MSVMMKCKMCGGELNIEEGSLIAECTYCGSKQTIPSLDDDKKLKMFERANRLRFSCEFDKAAGVYESIVDTYETEAEAYWGLILCKYGVEYVDERGKRVPTCHRTSFSSVMEDDNFDLIMENSEGAAQKLYREEAKKIEEIRKGIIEVSSKEDPYDIFICYKETDEEGNRTEDSVMAQDIYEEFTSKGYRVFFSRVSMEDKLGQEYEPYIFAALNSARLMLVVGSTYENFNAVWTKNEWSRYIKLMESDKSKHLIPCYKDIDAYDMPKEFSKLQAQDMSKIGAIQDLVRGAEKLLGDNKTRNKSTVVDVEDIAQQLDDLAKEKRKKMNDARKKKIKKIVVAFSVIVVIGIALFFGISYVIPNYKYKKAVQLMENGEYSEAIEKFEAMEGYKDSEQNIIECRYSLALDLMSESKYEEAIIIFEELGEYKQSKDNVMESNYEIGVFAMQAGESEKAYEHFRMVGDYKDANSLTLEVASIGDEVSFGNYKGRSEWIVLEKQDNKILVISKFVIEKMPFHSHKDDSVTWETSDIRKWLNDSYFFEAFSDVERNRILDTYVQSSAEIDGNDTIDKVYLLSNEEIQKYHNDERNGLKEMYVKKQVASWWLRDRSDYMEYGVMRIRTSGLKSSSVCAESSIGARPVMWIDISDMN